MSKLGILSNSQIAILGVSENGVYSLMISYFNMYSKETYEHDNPMDGMGHVIFRPNPYHMVGEGVDVITSGY